MRWDWDFIRGRKTDLPASPPTVEKLITVNGRSHPIQEAHLSDMQVASQVRMLQRMQLDHERVCTLARDRIVYLADRIGEIEATSVEAIAKIVDPRTWTVWEATYQSMLADGMTEENARKTADYHWLSDKEIARAKAAQILAIKTGALPYQAVASEIEDLLVRVEVAAANSPLPESADREWIDDFVFEAHRKELAGVAGLEPAASGFGDRRSST